MHEMQLKMQNVYENLFSERIIKIMWAYVVYKPFKFLRPLADIYFCFNHKHFDQLQNTRHIILSFLRIFRHLHWKIRQTY